MEKKIFEILEKMKLEVITLDEAHKQLCVLFGVIVELPKNNSVVFKRKIIIDDTGERKFENC